MENELKDAAAANVGQPVEAKKAAAPKKDAAPKEADAPEEAEEPKFEKPKPKPGQLLMVHKTRTNKDKSPLYRSVTEAEVKAFEENGFILDPATAVKQ